MIDFIATVLIVVLPIGIGAEWWRIRRRCHAQILEIHARYRRDLLRADDALAAAKRQIVSLQHRLIGNRVEALRGERPASSATDRAIFGDAAPLLMMGGRVTATTRDGFADTVGGP